MRYRMQLCQEGGPARPRCWKACGTEPTSSADKFCVKCGTVLKGETASFRPAAGPVKQGYRLRQEPVISPPSPLREAPVSPLMTARCPSCNHPMFPNAVLCVHCGWEEKKRQPTAKKQTEHGYGSLLTRTRAFQIVKDARKAVA